MHNHFLLIIFWLMSSCISAQTFAEKQQANARVKQAYDDDYAQLVSMLKEQGFSTNDFRMYIRVFKEEELMEIWVRHTKADGYTLLYTVPVCSMSGGPGPKRKEGDLQVPEGFYRISQFNPQSKFWLSLGINYPNASDKILSDSRHPGGAIFIHGNCVSIGCIAIRDNPMQRLYILSVEARSNGQQEIPVHIFPCRLDGERYSGLKMKFKEQAALISFWEDLRKIDQVFVGTKKLPEIAFLPDGRYALK